MIRQCVGIIGTDTDVGKTVVVAALARALQRQGKKVLLLKPVQTGCKRKEDGCLEAPDVCVYKDAVPLVETRVCVMLEAACSPHLASQLESVKSCSTSSRSLSANALANAIAQEFHASNADVILIEGSGGLLTPLNETESLADVWTLLVNLLSDSFNCSTLLVISNKLGAINHALLSCEIAKTRGFAMLGFVMTQIQDNTSAGAKNSLDAIIQKDNGKCIARMSNLPCLGHIKYAPLLQHDNPNMRQKAWENLADDAENIVRFLQQDSLAIEPIEQIEHSEYIEPTKPIKNLMEYDRRHIWHPYTSAINPLPVWEAVGTQGTHIRLRNGCELIDGMASWWCAIHGYNHPALLQALHGQSRRMPHVMFGGLTHEPAVSLAQKLLAVAPSDLEHVFFSDSGSVAVEVALKIAVQYQQAIGNSKRTRILAFKGAYHGDTLGAMSVCDPENSMHSLFTGVMPQQLFAPRPDCPFHKPYDPESIVNFETILKEQSDIAAVIIEPIVQGAGGMYFYHPDYLQNISQLCKEYGCLLILDEIATGFGRTGKYFACEYAKVQPDIFCVGKGLTGGVLSLAATLASHKVAKGIAGKNSPTGGVLMHGPTFMGNPLACAVAVASLDLMADGTWQNDVKQIEQHLQAGLAPCLDMSGVRDVRTLGAIGVVEMHKSVNVAKLQRYFVDKWQVWIRPFSRLIYVMPPYCIKPEEVKRLTTAICSAIKLKMWR